MRTTWHPLRGVLTGLLLLPPPARLSALRPGADRPEPARSGARSPDASGVLEGRPRHRAAPEQGRPRAGPPQAQGRPARGHASRCKQYHHPFYSRLIRVSVFSGATLYTRTHNRHGAGSTFQISAATRGNRPICCAAVCALWRENHIGDVRALFSRLTWLCGDPRKASWDMVWASPHRR